MVPPPLPLVAIIQDDLLRDDRRAPDRFKTIMVQADHAIEDQLQSAADLLASKARPVVLASIDVCQIIKRKFPFLARGVIFNHGPCRASRLPSLVGREICLNRDFIILPFGEIVDRREQIETLFGRRIFLRPDDSRKAFPGCSLQTDELRPEVSMLRQIFRVQDEELCLVDRHKDIQPDEYRCWLVDGSLAASAAYRHGGASTSATPEAVISLARRLARDLEHVDNALVADFCLLQDGAVKAVELNCFSTSGVYGNCDLDALLGEVDAIMT